MADSENKDSNVVAETSMTGQDLLHQIESVINQNQLASLDVIPTSPIDTSPTICAVGPGEQLSSNGKTRKQLCLSKNIDEGTSTAIINNSSSTPPPPVVYGELSILGYNGYIPNSERSGRRNKSKFLLCKRPVPNGIKKSEHYFVTKQPQATKAIQDRENYSISYTFSRSQTIIVEYKRDDQTDLFQIGRSSEDPIDFVVMDTVPSGPHLDSHNHHSHRSNSSNKHSASPISHHHHSSNQNYSERASSSHHVQQPFDLVEMTRFHRHLAKVGEEMLSRGVPPYPYDPRGRMQAMYGHVGGHPQQMILNYPQPNLSNLPPLMAEHFRRQDPSLYHLPNSQFPGSSHYTDSHHHHHQPPHLSSVGRPNHAPSGAPALYEDRIKHNSHLQPQKSNQSSSKRSHAAQSTISRFACRIIVDRDPPYTARIYAAGFDSSKNIFLGEKATKWEQNSSIDGLTTNGILLMHPKRGYYCEKQTDSDTEANRENRVSRGDVSTSRSRGEEDMCIDRNSSDSNESGGSGTNDDTRQVTSPKTSRSHARPNADTNNNCSESNFQYGGVWREVSVDGGIYAIRESRSAIQKGKRIENETNILQDGTLIDLCGATLLWRSVDGFKSSPSKKTLEEKIDLLNASRPQCPVGLNTLVIPRKPIHGGSHAGDRHKRSSNHHGHSYSPIKDHHSSNYSEDKGGSSQQPYVYLKCGHVQGYHDWGATEKSNQRTCPICLSVGTVAKLSMGLEPSFYVDSGPLTHVFNPCGHMASERTIKYWTSIKIPHGTHFFHSICPFCATPLATDEPNSIRLIFQEDLD